MSKAALRAGARAVPTKHHMLYTEKHMEIRRELRKVLSVSRFIAIAPASRPCSAILAAFAFMKNTPIGLEHKLRCFFAFFKNCLHNDEDYSSINYVFCSVFATFF